MTISEAHVGRRYPATAPYPVTSGKIAEFATALGESNVQRAGDEVLAPPTFLAVLAAEAWQAMFDDPELGLALRRIVHGDQKFTFGRPLRAGDRVTSTLVIDKVRSRGSADIITASVEVRDDRDELVGTATATFFHSREPDADTESGSGAAA